MEKIEGTVVKIVFRNSDNGYSVLSLETEDDEVTLVGSFPMISVGEQLSAMGDYTLHPTYGPQFSVKSYEIIEPADMTAMEKYLASGAIKGIKAATAKKIVAKFGDKTFEVIENNPELLAQIKGISEKKAMDIGIQFMEKRELRSAIMFLAEYGISMTFAVKIYKKYGSRLYSVVKENPYKLVYDIDGIGFRMADEIALRSGINSNNEERIKAGIMYVLGEFAGQGNVYVPRDMLINEAAKTLLIDTMDISLALDNMTVSGDVVIKERDEETAVYPASFYYMELSCARMLHDINLKFGEYKDVDAMLKTGGEDGIILESEQKDAVKAAFERGVTVITGGPGTGKTTTIKTMIRLFELGGMNVLLAAPTGRAAKRMSEATGYEAITIHRLLEVQSVKEDEGVTSGRAFFLRDEHYPLEADVIIIDEMSMVDLPLFHALLKAIPVGTRIILAGDVDQLSSVGPGNVLKDIIKSGCFITIKLDRIFRQAQGSAIITNAHKINKGELINMDNKSKDFFVINREDCNVVIAVILELLMDRLPRYVGCDMKQIQVLSPMKKGELGVVRLNSIIQDAVNPEKPGKRSVTAHGTVFREGDKVMHIKNNYQKEWEMKSPLGIVVGSGTGVFNGDCGNIVAINDISETISVLFDDNRLADYSFAELEDLELAYAITIHKSQGSEYPAVIIPILSGPQLLMNRNLLYTAVTRARKCVFIVGRSAMVTKMIENDHVNKRYSSLETAICSMKDS